jgi:hypothetical protein
VNVFQKPKLALLTVPVLAALTACIASSPMNGGDKFALNERFNTLEQAYWPKPVRLQSENVLVIGYKSWGFCDDVCNEILNGRSGARVYYAQYEYPAAPDFRAPVDLNAIAQGRLQPEPGNPRGVIYTPFAAGQEKPTFDHVLIDMREPITPILVQAFSEYEFRPRDGDAWIVFAPVTNDRDYQLTAQGAHYIDFARDSKRFGDYNSWHSSYSFVNGPDLDAEAIALQNMVCGPYATDAQGCAR